MSNFAEYELVYEDAYKLGKQVHNSGLAKGDSGYLPSLDGVLQTGNVLSEVPLGLVKIPLKQVVGTYTHSRSIAFAENFMPVMDINSEFAVKWINLYGSHTEEGIRDPIKVYEYYNLFYVIEGNKRVSVLKYDEALTIEANVIRLIPKRDPNNTLNNIYFEFIGFYKETGINNIWFSKEGRFTELLEFIDEYDPDLYIGDNKIKSFMADIYRPFRRIYYDLDGDKKSLTTGDAFLHFIKVYGMPEKIDSKDVDDIKSFMSELDVFESKDDKPVQTGPIDTPKKSVLTSLSSLVRPKKQLQVAFVYAGSPTDSGWVNAHDLGRLHINNVFGDEINTKTIENVPEDDSAYDIIRELAKENDIVFTTSPTYIAPTLKAALEFPDVKFFTCAATHSYKNLTLYFGRIHEPWYLLGMVAGIVTKTNVIGFIAPMPISEVVSAVNAFALGALAVNPRAVIKPSWTYKWQDKDEGKDATKYLKESGADVIANDSMPTPGSTSREYGIYMDDKHYAMAIWDWGSFYEKVIQNILSGTWKDVIESSYRDENPMNFWLGMDTGIVDIMYSNRNMETPTKQLIDSMKKSIIRKEFTVFEGPIYDQDGDLRVNVGEKASYEQIINMDWFIKGVEGEMPNIKDLTPSDPLSYMRDIVSDKK